MKLTAKAIIPDKWLTSDLELGQNLYNARHVLDKFIQIFGRLNEAGCVCLYEILNMDVDQARDFLKGDPHTQNARYLLNPDLYDMADHVFATLQLMLYAYLSEQMILAA